MSVADLLKFLLGLFLFVYAPGRALLGVFRIRRPGAYSAILIPAAGMAASVFVNKYARLLGAEFLFYAAIAAAVVYVLVSGWRGRAGIFAFRPRFTRTEVILTVCFLCLAAMLAVDGYRNGISRPDGTVSVRMHYYDGFIRNAVIGELAHSVPPEMPFAAGTPLGYHYGMDLFLSLFVRYLGLDVFDLVFRLGATFFWGLLLFTAFLFARVFFDDEKAGILAAVLVVFGGGGWTWVATLARGTPLGGNPFYSLYLFDGLGVNSLIPGFALAFSGLAVLVAYLRDRRPTELVLAAVLLAAAVEFKVFLGPPLLGAMIVCGIAAWIFVRDRGLLLSAAAFIVALIPLGLAALAASGRGGPNYHYALSLIDWPGRVLADLRLENGLMAWNAAVHEGRFSLAALGLVPAAGALSLIGALGPSVFALPRMVRDFFAGPKNSARFFISGLTAACFLYFFVFEVSLGPLDRTILNVYVFYFGLMLVLVYAAGLLTRSLKKRGPAGRVILPVLALLLALPNTILFLHQKLRLPEETVFAASYMEVCRWIGENTPPEAVILQPTAIRHLSFFAARRVVLDDSVNSYLDFHLPREEISRRRDLVNRFFADPRKSPSALSAFGVTHVLRPLRREFPESPDGNVSLDGVQLTRIFLNGEFTVYRVDRPGL